MPADNNPDQEKDETAKEVKVDTGAKEEIPDYEVTEIPDEESDNAGAVDDKDDDDDDDHDEDDRRLSKAAQREGEREDKKKLSNREKRALKKKRVAEKFDAKDREIRNLREENQHLSRRMNDVDSRFAALDEAQFTNTWNATVDAFQATRKKYTDAFSAGDGETATNAMQELYQLQRSIDDMESIRARRAAAPRQGAQPAKPDPRIQSKAQSWVDRNPWFKVGGKTEDSAIADTIANTLKREGYDPTTDDYWDELDERLARRGIGQDDDHDDEEDDYDDQPARKKEPARRRGPPVGSGNASGRSDLGGKTQVKLPMAYIKTLKDHGYWDDPAKRNKMINAYLKGVKERGEA